MKLRSAPAVVLSAVVIAAFGFTGNAAMAGKGDNNGNSGNNGGGSSSSSSNSNSNSSKSQAGSRGTVASNLKKANGAIHSSNTAWMNASANGVPGIARTYAEAQAGIDNFEGDIDQLKLDKTALELAISYEDYDTQIAALKLEDFADEVAYNDEVLRLEGLRDDAATMSDAEIATEIELIQADLDEYEGYETAKADALARLIGDRELSAEAIAELEVRVDAYLVSDQYLATVKP